MKALQLATFVGVLLLVLLAVILLTGPHNPCVSQVFDDPGQTGQLAPGLEWCSPP